MLLTDLNKVVGGLGKTEKMPVLFLGHGNPMNAIIENEFAHGWQQMGKSLPLPHAILCVSAHWETKGTYATAMKQPKTIHDFYGFPKALFDVEYPAPGSPVLATETKNAVTKTEVGLDDDWGLDHGCWSVLKHLYPKADVPVVQVSLDYTKPAQWHYELAKELASLRNKGVLIIGSGNIVHNLRMIDFHNPGGFDWAIEANTKMKRLIETRNHQSLINYSSLGKEVQLSIPTPEHYLPLLYTLALQEENETISFFNDKTEVGSISMTSIKIDK